MKYSPPTASPSVQATYCEWACDTFSSWMKRSSRGMQMGPSSISKLGCISSVRPFIRLLSQQYTLLWGVTMYGIKVQLAEHVCWHKRQSFGEEPSVYLSIRRLFLHGTLAFGVKEIPAIFQANVNVSLEFKILGHQIKCDPKLHSVAFKKKNLHLNSHLVFAVLQNDNIVIMDSFST